MDYRGHVLPPSGLGAVLGVGGRCARAERSLHTPCWCVCEGRKGQHVDPAQSHSDTEHRVCATRVAIAAVTMETAVT